VRAACSAEQAPARLAERIRAGLAEVERESELSVPAPARAASARVSPRARGWGLTAVAAAAMILIVAGGLLWPASGQGLVQAMAAEHYEHSQSGDQLKLEKLSADSAELEKYLTAKLGLDVRLPAQSFPQSRGACCCQRGGGKMGLVACFCARRQHAVTLFVVRAEGAPLGGLETVVSGGRTFWRGSAGHCRAVMWKSGGLLYALVGEFQKPPDHLDLAARAAQAIDERAP